MHEEINPLFLLGQILTANAIRCTGHLVITPLADLTRRISAL